MSLLTICTNHIGNPKDLPARTIEVLKKADIVYAEDTRSCGRLLKSLDVSAKMVSYYDAVERKRVSKLRDQLLKEELSIALISESGMPLISDPGYHLVNLFHELNLPIEVIPGPSAFMSALVMSGFPLQTFTYVGFWPRKKKSETELIQLIKQNGHPVVFYESPHRIVSTVDRLKQILPDAQLFIVKELTKTYERYWKGTAASVYQQLNESNLKGEFVGVIHA